MVRGEELKARIKDHFSFEREELYVLVPAAFLTAFIFSFNDWGKEALDIGLGLRNLFLMTTIVALSFFVRFSSQKIYALKEGYKAQYSGWWTGIIIALIIALLSKGSIPLVLIGGVAASFMVRQRLGEFRYGFSYSDNAKISFSGIIANLVLAQFFAIGLFFFPENYFFSKGLLLNWIMAACAVLPLPQLDGLNIYFGSRSWYYVVLAAVAVFGVLLLTGTQIGLIIAVVITAITAIIQLLMEP